MTELDHLRAENERLTKLAGERDRAIVEWHLVEKDRDRDALRELAWLFDDGQPKQMTATALIEARRAALAASRELPGWPR